MHYFDYFLRLMPRKTVIMNRVLPLFLILLLAPAAEGQETRTGQQAPPISERIYFGGNFGLQIGTYTDIEVSPEVGIWLQPRIAVAAGPSIRYMKDPLGKTDVYGGKAYLRFVRVFDISNIIPVGVRLSLFMQAEYETLSFRSDWFGTATVEPRTTVSTAFAGFGFSQPMGRKGSIDIALLFVIYDSGYEIYSNPEYRIGFTF